MHREAWHREVGTQGAGRGPCVPAGARQIHGGQIQGRFRAGCIEKLSDGSVCTTDMGLPPPLRSAQLPCQCLPVHRRAMMP